MIQRRAVYRKARPGYTCPIRISCLQPPLPSARPGLLNSDSRSSQPTECVGTDVLLVTARGLGAGVVPMRPPSPGFPSCWVGLGRSRLTNGGPALVWTLDTGDRRIDRSSGPLWRDLGEALVKGQPLSPPMSRDMISANLTFQFVLASGPEAKRGGPGAGPPRKAPGALVQLSGQLDVMGAECWRTGNPSACDIGNEIGVYASRWLQCEFWVEYTRVWGWAFCHLVYALQLKRKPGGASTRKE